MDVANQVLVDRQVRISMQLQKANVEADMATALALIAIGASLCKSMRGDAAALRLVLSEIFEDNPERIRNASQDEILQSMLRQNFSAEDAFDFIQEGKPDKVH